MNWLDRVTMDLAPRWTLRRVRARAAVDMLARNYDAAAMGRRTQGWRRGSGDVNATVGSGLERTREVARDLVRNNAWIRSAINTIVDHVVGWGIVAQVPRGSWWKEWAETTACDADGRLDFYGIQKQVVRAMAQDGEVLVRRRWRRPADGLPIPMQLQVIESDLLDLTKEGKTEDGNRIIQGVEFNRIGQRVGYWLYSEHPGARGPFVSGTAASSRVPASEILHVFSPERPGQVRGMSWLSAVILRAKDLDDFEDAALMKQKVAACLAVITSDVDGTATALGSTTTAEPLIDRLEPGIIANVTPGRSVTVVDPPSVSEHGPYTQTILRAIASGIGIAYEDLTGDFSNTNFSSARMARIRAWARVEDWRWRLLVPQLCDPVWDWAQEAAALSNKLVLASAPEWTAPAMPSVDPETESNSSKRLVRIGGLSWGEMVRERGYDPDKVLSDIKAWNTKLDAAGVILDCDPRKTTDAGNPREAAAKPAEPAAVPAVSPNGNGNGSRNGHVEDRPAPAADLLALKRDVAELRALVIGQAMADPVAIQNNIRMDAPPAPNVTIADGAIQVHAAPAPNVHVDGPTVNVAPAELRMEPGAIRGGDVHVAPPPPAEVHVDARTTLEAGALQVPVSVAAPPPAEVLVDARTTIADGAVRVEAPVTVQQAPAPPTVTVVRAPARPAVEPGSGVPATDAE